MQSIEQIWLTIANILKPNVCHLHQCQKIEKNSTFISQMLNYRMFGSLFIQKVLFFNIPLLKLKQIKGKATWLEVTKKPKKNCLSFDLL